MDFSVARVLDLLAWDISTRPEALVPLTEALSARVEQLTEGVTVDLDAPIEGDVVL
jgi:antitoxin PrlF